jgi:DNA-binding response OmpR family regulator
MHISGFRAMRSRRSTGVKMACAPARPTRPDLVILDIRLPDIDGFEVPAACAQPQDKEIPIIFPDRKRERSDRLKGLELQADDYITKPFDIQELRLRVRNALQRSRQGSLTNPVTGLPEGGLVDEALQHGLDPGSGCMVVDQEPQPLS